MLNRPTGEPLPPLVSPHDKLDCMPVSVQQRVLSMRCGDVLLVGGDRSQLVAWSLKQSGRQANGLDVAAISAHFIIGEMGNDVDAPGSVQRGQEMWNGLSVHPPGNSDLRVS